MATKIKNFEKGSWFSFDENDKDSGRICLRPLSQEKLEEFTKECTKTVVEYKAGGKFRHEVEQFDKERYDELMLQYVIVSWEGLEDDEGKEIKCTNRNKYLIPRKYTSINMFITNRLNRLNRDSLSLKEKERKN